MYLSFSLLPLTDPKVKWSGVFLGWFHCHRTTEVQHQSNPAERYSFSVWLLDGFAPLPRACHVGWTHLVVSWGRTVPIIVRKLVETPEVCVLMPRNFKSLSSSGWQWNLASRYVQVPPPERAHSRFNRSMVATQMTMDFGIFTPKLWGKMNPI